MTMTHEEWAELSSEEQTRLTRAAHIAGIRAIADFYEASPELSIPWEYRRINVWPGKEELARYTRALKAFTGKPVNKDFAGATFKITTAFGPEVPGTGYTEETRYNRDKGFYEAIPEPIVHPNELAVQVTVCTSRKEVCTARVVATELKEVDVYPNVEPVKTMQEVDVIEWECNPILDGV